MAKNRFKILIVEDDSNIRTFVRTMLEAEGIRSSVRRTALRDCPCFPPTARTW